MASFLVLLVSCMLLTNFVCHAREFNPDDRPSVKSSSYQVKEGLILGEKIVFAEIETEFSEDLVVKDYEQCITGCSAAPECEPCDYSVQGPTCGTGACGCADPGNNFIWCNSTDPWTTLQSGDKTDMRTIQNGEIHFYRFYISDPCSAFRIELEPTDGALDAFLSPDIPFPQPFYFIDINDLSALFLTNFQRRAIPHKEYPPFFVCPGTFLHRVGSYALAVYSSTEISNYRIHFEVLENQGNKYNETETTYMFDDGDCSAYGPDWDFYRCHEAALPRNRLALKDQQFEWVMLRYNTSQCEEITVKFGIPAKYFIAVPAVPYIVVDSSEKFTFSGYTPLTWHREISIYEETFRVEVCGSEDRPKTLYLGLPPHAEMLFAFAVDGELEERGSPTVKELAQNPYANAVRLYGAMDVVLPGDGRSRFDCKRGLFYFENSRSCIENFPTLLNPFVPVPRLLARSDDKFQKVNVDFTKIPGYKDVKANVLKFVLLLEFQDTILVPDWEVRLGDMELEFNIHSPVVGAKSGLPFSGKVKPKKKLPSCNQKDFREIINLIDELQAKLSEKLTFTEATTARYMADILAFSDAWVGCRRDVRSLLSESAGSLEVKTAECVHDIGTDDYKKNPCCNRVLAWESECCEASFQDIHSPELTISSGELDSACSGDLACVESYLDDFIFYERFGHVGCNSIIGDVNPLVQRSVQFYYQCRLETLGRDFLGTPCAYDSDCRFSTCDRIAGRCLHSPDAEDAFFSCLDKRLPSQLRQLMSRSLKVNAGDVIGELRKQAVMEDCINQYGPDFSSHQRYERMPYGKPGELCQNALKGITSCYDTACPVPLRYEGNKRNGRDESACDFRWMPVPRLPGCGAPVCNWNNSIGPAEIPKCFASPDPVCVMCEAPGSCVHLPGNYTQLECESNFACFLLNGSMVVTQSEAECEAMNSCNNDCPLHYDYSNNTLPEVGRTYSWANPALGQQVQWTFLNYTDDTRTAIDAVEITYGAPGYAYIGIGFGRVFMHELDTVVCWVDDSGMTTCYDGWAVVHGAPKFDTELGGRSDIEVVQGFRVNGYTQVTFRRKLRTGDEWDHDIEIGMMDMTFNFLPQILPSYTPGNLAFHLTFMEQLPKGFDWTGQNRPFPWTRVPCDTKELCESEGGSCTDQEVKGYIHTIFGQHLRIVDRICITPLNPFNRPDCKVDIHSTDGFSTWNFGCARLPFYDEDCNGVLHWLSDGTEDSCTGQKLCKEPSLLTDIYTVKSEADCKACGGELVEPFKWTKGRWGGGLARRFKLEPPGLMFPNHVEKTIDFHDLYRALVQGATDTVIHQYKSQLQCSYNPTKHLIGQVLCRCSNGDGLCEKTGKNIGLATATVCPSFGDTIVAPPFIMELSEHSVDGSSCVDFTVDVVYSSEFASVQSSNLATTFREVQELERLEVVINQDDAVVGELIGNAIRITGENLGRVKNVKACFSLENSLGSNKDYDTYDFATYFSGTENQLKPLGLKLTKEGGNVCGEIGGFDDLNDGLLAPIKRIDKWKDKSNGSSLEDWELAIFIVVAVIFFLVALLQFAKLVLALWWFAILHNITMMVLLFAAGVVRTVYFVLLSVEVFDVSDETVAQVILVEIPTFFYIGVFVILVLVMAHILFGYHRKRLNRNLFVWIPFVVMALLLTALFVVVIVLFETSNGTTVDTVDCGDRTIITDVSKDDRPNVLRIVYKSIICGIALFLAVVLIVSTIYFRFVSQKLQRDHSVENRLTISCIIAGTGLICNCIAFIVYYIVDQPTAWFALVLLPTEALPWAVLCVQLKMHREAGTSTFPSSFRSGASRASRSSAAGASTH
mmetsp:Transcript_17632/g.44926  ORF Transcript_17632/g.44926 Transcript_17632/m.44926 type:complete len:1818 (+) Transcript_17632:144-5597(+)